MNQLSNTFEPICAALIDLDLYFFYVWNVPTVIVSSASADIIQLYELNSSTDDEWMNENESTIQSSAYAMIFLK